MNLMLEQESKFDSTKDASDLGCFNTASIVRDYATGDQQPNSSGTNQAKMGGEIIGGSATKVNTASGGGANSGGGQHKGGYDEAWQVDASNSSQSR